jgi:hypothetical protein
VRTGLDWADVCDDLAMSVSARTCGRKRKKTMTDPHEPMRDVRGSPMLSATSDTEPRSMRPLKTTGIIRDPFFLLCRGMTHAEPTSAHWLRERVGKSGTPRDTSLPGRTRFSP